MSRFRRTLVVTAVALLAIAAFAPQAINPPPAQAVSVTVVYDPLGEGAVNPCTPVQMVVCTGGADQTSAAIAIVQAAADYWASIIEDPHAMEIRVSWLDPAVSSLPDSRALQKDAMHRTTVGRVRLAPNWKSYFYDPTPLLDEEFLGRRTNSSMRLASGMMRPKLYRTLHPAEKTEAFLNNASEIVEVGYNGLEQAPPGTPDIGEDLLTIALHEVGHLFGLIGHVQQCSENVISSGYIPPAALTGSAPLAIKGYQYLDGVQKLDCQHLAAGGIGACKPGPGDQPNTSPDASTVPGLSIHDCTAHQALLWFAQYPGGRTRPSNVDILAVAAAKGWQQIDLPRKYSLGAGGAWSAAATWFGNRAPDADDDVYVVNQQAPTPYTTVTSAGNGTARNLFVSDENRVNVSGGKLAIGRAVWLAGPDSHEGPVRPIVAAMPPAGGLPEASPTVLTTLEVGGEAIVTSDLLGVEPGARLRLQGGQAQFGDVINSGSIDGRGTLGVVRSFQNGSAPSGNGTNADADGLIRAEGGLLRIVTPKGGGITTGTPLIDLDGPGSASPLTTARIHAIDGDIEFDAMIDSGFWADVRVGSGRTLRFMRNGIQQNYSPNLDFALRFEGGALGATLDAPASEFGGIVIADGIGRFTGRTTFGPSASVRLDLGGTIAGVNYDQIQIHDVAALNGTLHVSLKSGFVPQAGQSFRVVTYESRIGQFATVSLPPLPSARTWGMQYEPTALRLTVLVDTDVDNDGDSDAQDKAAIAQHFGPCPAAPAACPWDLTGDGIVNQQDINLWQQSV